MCQTAVELQLKTGLLTLFGILRHNATLVSERRIGVYVAGAVSHGCSNKSIVFSSAV